MVLPARILHLAAPLSLLLACGGPDTASHDGDTQTPNTTDLTAVLQRTLEAQSAPGAILGVRSRGGPMRLAAAGLADLESGRPITAEDPYFLGSIAKTYTATVVLQLVEEGKVGLEQQLADFLPALPNAEWITIRQLLQHSSGLEDVAVWAYFRPDREEMLDLLTRNWTVAEMLGKAAELEPMFEPGEDWAYSNTNYIVLGAVVEVASGDSLAGQIRSRILEPLGLESTWLNNWEPPPRALPVTGYLGPLPFWKHSEMFGDLGPTTPIDQGNLEWGAGGIVSTAAEAITFLDALLAGELISKELVGEMLGWVETPPLGAPGPDTPADLEGGYGLGIARQVRPGYTRIGHGGLYNGHTAGLWRIEECDATVAFYANRGFVDSRWVMDSVVEALDCAPTPAPAP